LIKSPEIADNPIVSVIVTTYNRQEYLAETILSILSQNFQDFELIIIDNYSNYDFVAFIDSFNDSRIKGFQNNNYGIIATNRNFGIARSYGKYLAFCDDDDIWLPCKLMLQMEEMRKCESKNERILVYTDVIVFNDRRTSRYIPKVQVHNLGSFLLDNPVTYSSVLLTRSECIGFSEDISQITVEDLSLWLSLICKGYYFKLLSEPLVKYRVSSDSMSRKREYMKYLRYLYVVLGRMIENPQARVNIFYFTFFTLKMLLKYQYKKMLNK
jgi:teichuronic acid biosynthesis glycosyltransferase TuaG